MCANPPPNKSWTIRSPRDCNTGWSVEHRHWDGLPTASWSLMMIRASQRPARRGEWADPRLVSEVSLDHVGIIFGVEMPRLARCNKDWHQLLELCALFHTLIADL